MAYVATFGKTEGGPGGIPANFGSKDVETSGTGNFGVVKVAGVSMGAPTAAGTVTASAVVTVDANKDVGLFRYIRSAQVIQAQGTPTSINTAGATTLTIAQLLTGIITIDCNGAGRTVTLPTAALLVAGIPGCAVGDTIYFRISNGSDAAETITLAEGSGGGWDSNFLAAKTIAQNAWADVIIRVTNVTASSEAYVVYK